ncbi:F-box family protein [Euphorbia peplus]|nr:F-box family protein [Euphorbia peplus]
MFKDIRNEPAKKLQSDLETLETTREQLLALKADVQHRIAMEERPEQRPLRGVELWLSMVETTIVEADELIKEGPKEVRKICHGDTSNYEFFGRVSNKLGAMVTLKRQGDFDEVVRRARSKLDFISKLRYDLRDLQMKIEELRALKEDVTRVMLDEGRQQKPLQQVQLWLLKVERVVKDAGQLGEKAPLEMEKFRLRDFSNTTFEPNVARLLYDARRLCQGADNISIEEMPEGCIAKILSFTDPKEACRSTIVSSNFRDVANSDPVWESFLPPDYHSILSDAYLRNFTSKKQLYLSLCDDPILIEDGKTSFWLDKRSGRKCYMISARGLSIIWGDTPQYWRWIQSDANSRFKENAELYEVCWLEIRGRIKSGVLSTTTNYGVFLVYKLSQIAYGFEDEPVEGVVKLVEDTGNVNHLRILYLDDRNVGRKIMKTFARRDRFLKLRKRIEEENGERKNGGKERRDGWLEIELGEFFNQSGEDGDLEMSLKEVKRLGWKGGLLLQGIEIRPKFTIG